MAFCIAIATSFAWSERLQKQGVAVMFSFALDLFLQMLRSRIYIGLVFAYPKPEHIFGSLCHISVSLKISREIQRR